MSKFGDMCMHRGDSGFRGEIFRCARWIAMGGAAALILAGAGAVRAQTAAYLRVVGPNGVVSGESMDAAHKNWIAVNSVVSGDLNSGGQADRESSTPSVSELTAREAASGRATGRAAVRAPRDVQSGTATGRRMHKPFVVMKKVDRASPVILQMSKSGQHLREVDVDLVSSGQLKHYKLMDVTVSSDKKSGSPGAPMETLAFNYAKIEMVK